MAVNKKEMFKEEFLTKIFILGRQSHKIDYSVLETIYRSAENVAYHKAGVAMPADPMAPRWLVFGSNNFKIV